MQKFNLTIIKNKLLLDVLNELKYFFNYEVFFYENLGSFVLNEKKSNLKHNAIIFCNKDIILEDLEKISINIPKILLISDIEKGINFEILKKHKVETVLIPIKIYNFISKIKIYLSKNIFLEKSLIKIKDYNLDLNKREISKSGIKLKLTEREINFLMHLNKAKEPISIKKILNDIWKYSFETETHTIETHVHRLRKKFLEKFNDKIIHNNKKKYFI